MPPAIGASTSDPLTTSTASLRLRRPCATETFSFASAMNAQVPTTLSRSSPNGPISAMRPGSALSGSRSPSFRSSTIERAPASRESFSIEGVETWVRSAFALIER